MTTSRRPRSDTATAFVKAAANAARPEILPPKHVALNADAARFWPGVVRARARDEWDDASLTLAAQLARCQAEIEREAALLEAEGSVVAGRLNPRAAVVDTLTRRELAMFRSLRMGGRVAGDTRDLVKRRLLERRALATREELLDDDLLA